MALAAAPGAGRGRRLAGRDAVRDLVVRDRHRGVGVKIDGNGSHGLVAGEEREAELAVHDLGVVGFVRVVFEKREDLRPHGFEVGILFVTDAGDVGELEREVDQLGALVVERHAAEFETKGLGDLGRRRRGGERGERAEENERKRERCSGGEGREAEFHG